MGKNESARRGAGFPSLSKWGLYILVALSNGELHGYGIRLEIERISAGKDSPSAASLYENIAKLLDAGLIKRAGEKVIGEGKVRKLYRLTGLGARVLNDELATLDRLRAAVPPKLDWALG